MNLPIIQPGEREKDRHSRLKHFLDRGEAPFDYEGQMFFDNREFLDSILDGYLVPPHHFEFLPSERCNNNCIWCKGGHRDFMVSERDLGEKQMLEVIDDLGDYGINGIVRFSGMSGEPLMNPGTLSAIRRGIERGLDVGLITNGILLDEKSYDALSGARYVSVSLDAGSREVFNRVKGHRDDTFYNVLENLEGLVKFRKRTKDRFRIGVSYMLHPLNYNDMIRAVENVHAIGVDLIQFKVPYLTGREFDEEQVREINWLLDEAVKLGDDNFRVLPMQTKLEREEGLSGKLPKPDFQRCFSQSINGVVGAEGNVYPCVHYYYNQQGNGSVSGEAFGNVYEQSFKDIWEGDKRKEVLGRINPEVDCGFCNRYDGRMNKFANFLMGWKG
jgi:GTP 3',8-cyclase